MKKEFITKYQPIQFKTMVKAHGLFVTLKYSSQAVMMAQIHIKDFT